MQGYTYSSVGCVSSRLTVTGSAAPTALVSNFLGPGKEINTSFTPAVEDGRITRLRTGTTVFDISCLYEM